MRVTNVAPICLVHEESLLHFAIQRRIRLHALHVRSGRRFDCLHDFSGVVFVPWWTRNDARDWRLRPQLRARR